MSDSTNFDGNIATYTYIPSGTQTGLLQQVVYTAAPGSGNADQTVIYTYDDLNRQHTVTDQSGTTTYHYDVQSNLNEEDTPEGVIHYVYDPATGRHTETFTDNTDTTYHYDAAGRIDTVTVAVLNGVTLNTPLVTTYTYDAVGDKKTETLPDGEVTTYGYDDLNRLTSVSEVQGTTTVFSQTYILNDDGTRASSDESQRQSNGSTVSWHTAWTYDGDQRLTGETVTSTGTPTRDYADTFYYDLAGNRVSDSHTDADASKDDSTADTYNSDDELTKRVSTLNGETDLTYDNNGSQTTSTNGANVTTYGYDVRNKMVSVTTPTTIATYVYEDAGNRVGETVNGVTTFYLTDDANPTGYAQPIEQKSSATVAPTITYLIGDRVYGQTYATGNVSYLLIDCHGSTQALTDATGSITQDYAYTAFGGSTGFVTNYAGTMFLFGGDAVYDPASSLYLHGDGTRGRIGFGFIQADTQGNANNNDPLSLHKYLYANANPIVNIDPSGHLGEDIEAAGLIGESLDANLTLTVRASVLAVRVTNIFLRVAQFFPALAFGTSVAVSVLEAGSNYMSQVSQRWSELQNVPTGAFGISRGNFLHQQANSNLGPYFPKIDDFREGFATSIKTTSTSDPDRLLSNIRGYLGQLNGIENQRLRGSDVNGIQIIINPGQIQAKGLLVAIPAQNESILGESAFTDGVQSLAEEFRTVIRIVPVDAFEE